MNPTLKLAIIILIIDLICFLFHKHGIKIGMAKQQKLMFKDAKRIISETAVNNINDIRFVGIVYDESSPAYLKLSEASGDTKDFIPKSDVKEILDKLYKERDAQKGKFEAPALATFRNGQIDILENIIGCETALDKLTKN